MKRSDMAWVLFTSLWAAVPLTTGAGIWALVVWHASPWLTFGSLPLSVFSVVGVAWG